MIKMVSVTTHTMAATRWYKANKAVGDNKTNKAIGAD
jgi:hypothetical protein